MSNDEQHFHPPGLTFMLDISAARWVEQRLGQNFAHVAALIPRGFARYARLFHPAQNRHGERVRWAEVAAWSGRTVHPLMAFERISAPASGYGVGVAPWIVEPYQGTFASDDVIAQADFLANFTDTPQRCFFAVWEGYGYFTPGATVFFCSCSFSESGAKPTVPVPEPRAPAPPAEVLTAERFTGVGRDYVLYAGLLSAVTSFHVNRWHPPNIWWPEDRKWCVATDIDLDSTYVGGSEACIDALVNDARFEVLPTTLDAPVYMEADTLNASG
ncbi:MAG: hypothetical protein ACREYF_19145 [Gammaproteobacteria bacterium]